VKSVSTFGAKAVINAERQREDAWSFQQAGLKPWEYAELMGDVPTLLKENSDKRVLIFADEANHIDPALQVDVLRSSLDSFLRRDVQFVFTARADVLQRVPSLKEAFPKVLALQGFSDQSKLNDLINLYLAGDAEAIAFADRAVQRIWELGKGHPARLQRLCQETYSFAQRENASEVSVDHVFDAALKIGRWELA
jgi:hypothetical protein